MKRMIAIYKKDVKSYFLSPIAYIVIGLFLFITSWIFIRATIDQGVAIMDDIFRFIILILLIISPILTMKLIAEEKKTGTYQLLLTSPISSWSIVLGKYFAVLSVYAVMLIFTFTFPIILNHYSPTGIDILPVVSGYIGLFLIGGAFLSFGLLASSLTENQIVAGVIGVISLFILYILDLIGGGFEGVTKKVFEFMSLGNRFNDFQIGILDTGNIVYYLSFIFIFLYLCVVVIEKRKWSRG